MNAEPAVATANVFRWPATRVVSVQAAGGLEELASQRFLVLASSTAGRSPVATDLLRSLGPRAVHAELHVGSHSRRETLDGIVAAAAGKAPDAILAIGGGSVFDMAKAVSMMLGEEAPLEALATRVLPEGGLHQPRLDGPRLPIVAFPSTLSGAETTFGFSIRDADGRKLMFWDPRLSANTVVMSQSLVDSVPKRVLAGSAFNALAHCVEAAYSRTRNEVTDALSECGARSLLAGMEQLASGDEQGRSRAVASLFTGAHFAALAITQARVGLHHAICHALGGRLGISHGDANALMLPLVVAFNAPHAGAPFDDFLSNIGFGRPREDAVGRLVERLLGLRDRFGLPSSLRHVQVERDHLAGLVADVLDDRGSHFNPKRPTANDIGAILGLAFDR